MPVNSPRTPSDVTSHVVPCDGDFPQGRERTPLAAAAPCEVRPARAAKPAFAAIRSGGGCWTAFAYDKWSDFTIAEGITWFNLNWCSDGSTVTTYDYRNVGAQGLLGFQFTGIAGNFEYNAGREAREAIEYRFSFEGKRFFVCEQLRGGATGLYSHRQDCNLS
ncbi:hypothetical protein AB5J72_10150 [Streptomyces sp. CG1]|uniref:hypothetical protein n=1 Tax=Streptomyces sp. CG1 TaxID=1287523 RepID=UPI0034E1D4A4